MSEDRIFIKKMPIIKFDPDPKLGSNIQWITREEFKKMYPDVKLKAKRKSPKP